MPKTGYHSTLKMKPFIFSYRTVKIEAWQVETKRLEQTQQLRTDRSRNVLALRR